MGFILIINIIICVIAGVIANQKNRSVLGWIILTIFIGIFGLLILAFMKPLKKCPNCGATVPMEAKVCMYCNYSFFKKNDDMYNPHFG